MTSKVCGVFFLRFTIASLLLSSAALADMEKDCRGDADCEITKDCHETSGLAQERAKLKKVAALIEEDRWKLFEIVGARSVTPTQSSRTALASARPGVSGKMPNGAVGGLLIDRAPATPARTSRVQRLAQDQAYVESRLKKLKAAAQEIRWRIDEIEVACSPN